MSGQNARGTYQQRAEAGEQVGLQGYEHKLAETEEYQKVQIGAGTYLVLITGQQAVDGADSVDYKQESQRNALQQVEARP